jgi:NAD(P)-dependent dehydrogenase (short-subunit alcohol dehydrogenase family)
MFGLSLCFGCPDQRARWRSALDQHRLSSRASIDLGARQRAVATLQGLRPLLARSPAPRAVAVSSTSSLAPANERVVQACLDGDETAAVALLEADPALGGTAGAYGTAKRALNRWVRRVAPASEWAGTGIALNVVASGVVDTPAASWIFADEAVRNAVETAAPQPFGGLPGRPEWVAELICWLSSADNRFVTGQIIFADGGAEAEAVSRCRPSTRPTSPRSPPSHCASPATAAISTR